MTDATVLRRVAGSSSPPSSFSSFSSLDDAALAQAHHGSGGGGGGGGGGGDAASSTPAKGHGKHGSRGLGSKGHAPRGHVGWARRAGALLLQHWFLVGTALSIVAAQQAPWVGSDSGPLHPQVTVKYFAVMSIFFISGVSMKTETMWGTITDVRMHAFIQGFALLVVPVLVRLLLLPLLALSGLHSSLLKGFMVVGCMPPPVSTSVILTKTAGGNEAAAIFNSALGSFLGVVVTPIELLLLVDPEAPGGALPSSSSSSSSSSPLSAAAASGDESSVALLAKIFAELSLTVVLPLVVGQLVRPQLGKVVDRHKPQLSNFSSFTLIVIIYTTFCNTFCGGHCANAPPVRRLGTELHDDAGVGIGSGSGSGGGAEGGPFGNVTTGGLVFTGAVVVLLQAALMAIVFRLACSPRLNRSWHLNFSRPDVVAVVFSAVHKSLTLGVPVLKVVFSTSPILPLLSTPLLMYHPLQIVLGGLLAPLIKTWVLSPDKEDHQVAKRGLPMSTTQAPSSSSSVSSSSSSSASSSAASTMRSSSSAPPPSSISPPTVTTSSSSATGGGGAEAVAGRGVESSAERRREKPSRRLPQELFIPFDAENPI